MLVNSDALFLESAKPRVKTVNTRSESGCNPGPVDEFGLLADRLRPLGRVLGVFENGLWTEINTEGPQ